MSRDYMLRMIEQIAAMLARILAKKQAGQITEARSEAESLPFIHQTISLTTLS